MANVNEPPACTDKTWSHAENAASGFELGSIGCVDEDTPLTYTITAGVVDPLSPKYSVGENSGTVTVAGVTDFETSNKTTMTITVTVRFFLFVAHS